MLAFSCLPRGHKPPKSARGLRRSAASSWDEWQSLKPASCDDGRGEGCEPTSSPDPGPSSGRCACGAGRWELSAKGKLGAKPNKGQLIAHTTIGPRDAPRNVAGDSRAETSGRTWQLEAAISAVRQSGGPDTCELIFAWCLSSRATNKRFSGGNPAETVSYNEQWHEATAARGSLLQSNGHALSRKCLKTPWPPAKRPEAHCPGIFGLAAGRRARCVRG